MDLSFWSLYISGSIQHVTFCVWLLSLCVFSRYVHLVASIVLHSFLRMSTISLYGYHNVFCPFIYIYFKFYFIFKLYKIVLVLPNIKMNPPQVYIHIFLKKFYLFLAVLGSHCWADFSLVVASKGYSPVAVHGLLVSVASLAAEHRL